MNFTGPCVGRSALMETDQPRALAVCRSCPSLTLCRAWVLSLDPEFDPVGVCGGLTETQRAQIVGAQHPRTCTWCGTTKTWADFHRDPTGSNGLKAYCKQCSNQRSKDNRAKERARAKAGTET